MRSYALAVISAVIAGLLFRDVAASFGSSGGWTDVDSSDETVKMAAAFAHQEMEQRSNSMYRTRMGQIIKAKSQVVSGINYQLTLTVEHTDCRSSGHGSKENVDLSKCGLTKTSTCDVEIWYQAWMDPPMKLTTFNCQNSNQVQNLEEKESKLSILGGPTEVEPTNPVVMEAVSFAIRQLNEQANGAYAVQLGPIRSSTTQIVAGVLIKAKVSLTLTSCMDRATLVHQCNSNSYQRETVECSVTVWDQPWRTPRHQLEEHKCGPAPDEEEVDTSLRFVKAGGLKEETLIGGGGHDGGRVVDLRPRIGSGYSHFMEFKAKFDRVYKTDEEEKKRFEQFRTNMRHAQFIQDHDAGDAVYGATRFADLTPEEFQTYVSKTWNKKPDPRMQPATIPNVDPPKDFDWRDHNIVTPVKNQGSCGSCWAFCVTGNIEGQWARKKSVLVGLSEQQLVDCDKLDEGCNGGLPSNAYEEIERMGGLETEEDYPYKGADNKCQFLSEKIKVYINGSVNISKDETEMKQWLYSNGPMAIGINAMAMQFYFGGISHPWKIFCPDALNHGVLIVGYGVKHSSIFGDTPYWIIKNSWGEHWGEKGYYLVYRGDGTCGLNEMVSSSIVN